MSNRLVCGLLAHVDAGKTTLAEAMLYCSGAIRKAGRVDTRDSFLDTDVQERERGITIFSKQARLSRNGTEITLLDTPGHVDFSGEMERALQVLDCAILVISATDGIDGHTQTLWHLLKKYNIPTYIFVNKTDIAHQLKEQRLEELRKHFGTGVIDMLSPEACEEMASCDEKALEAYLQENKLSDEIQNKLFAARVCFPCYFGSALKFEGIDELADRVASLVPPPVQSVGFGARVYKISHDSAGNRLTHLKVVSGTLHVRDMIYKPNDADITEKVNQIRLYSGEKYDSVDSANAGSLCAVTGLSFTLPGMGLGTVTDTTSAELVPVLSYRVIPPEDCDPISLLQKLRVLEEEEPLLHIEWVEQSREIHVQLMGDVQLEILTRLLKERFSLSVRFGEGAILYKETIENSVEGLGHYEPLRHYAEVRLLLEKGAPGSGIRPGTVCPEDLLDKNWQRLILTHITERQHPGILTGAPLTDVKITLLLGKAHLKHTEGGDFRQATYRAIRQGLMQAKCTLLEPWYSLRLEVPEECFGRAMSDLQQMNGITESFSIEDGIAFFLARVPVSTSRYYARDVSSYTHGKGHIFASFDGYYPCHNQDKIINESGYNPEADTENTPDSVFCAHGAGFNVRWTHVREFMHTDSSDIFKRHPELKINF